MNELISSKIIIGSISAKDIVASTTTAQLSNTTPAELEILRRSLIIMKVDAAEARSLWQRFADRVRAKYKAQ